MRDFLGAPRPISFLDVSPSLPEEFSALVHLVIYSRCTNLFFPLMVPRVRTLRSACASIGLSLAPRRTSMIVLWFVMEVITFSCSSTKFVFSICQRQGSGCGAVHVLSCKCSEVNEGGSFCFCMCVNPRCLHCCH